MTIDETIKFCYEKSQNIKMKAEPQTFIDIAEWLEELNSYKLGECMNDCEHYDNCSNYIYSKGYTKAIDDFAEKLHSLCGFEIGDFRYPFLLDEDRIDEVAEQLKAGRTNEDAK